jgi:hypothetical protein
MLKYLTKINKVQLEMAVFVIGIHEQKQNYNILQYICSVKLTLQSAFCNDESGTLHYKSTEV